MKMQWQGTIEHIYIHNERAEPLDSVAKVKAEAGRGLEGDRYYFKQGTFSKDRRMGREVTLIEAEAIEALRNDYGLQVDWGDPRRNIVTRGVPLNHLVGRQFRVGDALFLGIRLCEPCGHLADLTEPKVREGLIHRGGLRAEIVEGAEIKPGDAIVPVEAQSVAAETR
jgi:MOSC domain-containing protein YiiM